MSLTIDAQAQLRLLQFLSTSLPVGSYSYSQGVEWAVEAGWLHDETSYRVWISEQIHSILAHQELPLLIRLYAAVKANDIDAFNHWCQLALAVRDTMELRQEEKARATAYLRVFKTVACLDKQWSQDSIKKTPLASMALYSVSNNIPVQALLLAFSHNWLESAVITGVKAIPLGQSSGQKMLYDFAPAISDAVEFSYELDDENVGLSQPALNMASCRHEQQYSRIYRS